uniref:Uncharacterized protein n=1 Tax=Trypanosoma congolense (strain IL3000) TaxID=1068625 RepID=G0UKD1_TRYCI|nr:conserved hypothetical protein [Trypanosoma congolense IL3000]
MILCPIRVICFIFFSATFLSLLSKHVHLCRVLPFCYSHSGGCARIHTASLMFSRYIQRGAGSAQRSPVTAFVDRPSSGPYTFQVRKFIEHNSCPKKWRCPETADVRRRHAGVKLGSEYVRIKEQAELEQQLLNADKLTNWNIVTGFAAAAATLLIALNILVEMVEPNSSPEYTPYTPPPPSDGK